MKLQHLGTTPFILCTGALCPAQVVTTIAGTGIAGFSGDGGPANAAQINSPLGLSFDAKGDLYFADSQNQRIRMIAANPAGSLATGTITTVAGNGMLNSLQDSQGETEPEPAGPALSVPLQTPAALLALPNGGFYFNDETGYFVNAVGSLTPDLLNNPAGFALDPQGNIYGFDFNGTNVYKYTPGAATETSVAGNPNMSGDSGDGGAATAALFTAISAIASDASGNIYVFDGGVFRIRKFKVGGTITAIAGNGLAAQGAQMYGLPATSVPLAFASFALAVDGNGNVYFDDGSRIDYVNAKGIINHFAGTDTGSYPGDGGAAISTYFGGAQYLAVDSSNNLYASTNFNRILEFGAAQACVTNCGPAPVIAGVSSAATNKQTITPGDWVSI